MLCRDKLTYHNELTAATACIECEFKRAKELFWYWCYKCEGYHLTHVAEGKDIQRFRQLKAGLLKPKVVVEAKKKPLKGVVQPVVALDIEDILLKFRAGTPDYKTFKSVDDCLEWNINYPDRKVSVGKVQAWLATVRSWDIEKRKEWGHE